MSVAAPLRKDNRVVGAVSLSQPLQDVAAVLGDLRLGCSSPLAYRLCSRRWSD